MNKKSFFVSFLLCGVLFSFAFSAYSQKRVPEPKDVLGFTPGDDYKLASWAKIVEYFKKLDASSNRVIFKEIGKTTEGKPFTYAVISSPKNLKKLDYYININDKLADPRLIKRSDKKARKLIKKGKTFVLITHGIHSTEVGSTLSSTLIAHKLASSNDTRIKKILDKTIIVIVPSLNPDGVDIVKDWYDKTLGTKFEGTSPPELYQKYVGHDNNRDWYAFTQIETQLTVEKIHNVFHPQIVHDIHQQGKNGARFFVPPYLDPVEPNVPKEIIEGYTEIGNYIAKQMRKDGLKGITTNSTYDAWTPARAYSHYHGGARILSETASAKLASPVEIKYKDLTSRRGFDVNKESKTYSPLWMGGKWGMSDITNYMTTGAFHLLDHAAENRKEWLERFYKIGKNATRPRKSGESIGFLYEDSTNVTASFLDSAGVEFHVTEKGVFVPLEQPYGSFAKALLEKQEYPNLKDEKGNPIPPYDVTAHSLALLMGIETIEQVYSSFKFDSYGRSSSASSRTGPVEFAIYKSAIPSMDEGWTRWISTKKSYKFDSVDNDDIRAGNLFREYGHITQYGKRSPIYTSLPAIIFPDQSPNSILNGYKEGTMPQEYVGGLKGKGVENLKKFVENGGTLVFLNRSSNFAIEQFDLPVKNIAKGWKRKDFFIPGSILRTELDTSHPIAKRMPEQSIAWFERSPVFDVTETSRVKVIAKYPSAPEQILLSGWALGAHRIAGKAALVEVQYGKGKIILFGFRPQYRGQSLATFPLLFNAIAR